MDILDILKKAAENQAADIFIVCGAVLSFKANGRMYELDGNALSPEDTKNLVLQIFHLAKRDITEEQLPEREKDFSLSVAGVGRFRVNIYKQRGSFSAVLRYVPFDLPDPAKLGIPEQVMQLSECKSGIVLITGVASSGKSTTLSCILDRINQSRSGHIITIEDPIEFLHKHNRCIVSQREINIDTDSYIDALRAALRQSPDVILLGEMRDYETISVAMTAAETGQLVLSTLHTLGAANSISRIIDVFEPSQQHQIIMQLSMVLQAVISQQLVPDVNGKNIPVFEIMRLTPAIRNMIRDNKIHQIDGVISSSPGQMRSMDQSLFELYKNGRITKETAINYAMNPEMLRRRLG